ncbi:MAG: DNA primase [Nitrososphaerota archaeon]|nr:DNA primase DnaG [Nitrososphaerota archaeon]MDG6911791.1 DNA primase [Nitrososphaerota archaeon]MDG6940727.1 DNA primase [Nitrososphaerota archaeon]MDG6945668.1 DNA primase [Nitrososphaerota archaeon]MDG6961037.1 DNA primase [Nitrososphaerota archaeon]
MPDSGIVKYLVRLRFEVDGVVERADVIGAIFGQTEGLFGPEMNLNELQKSWKVGRIEINLESKDDRTRGEVIIPMSTDIGTAALIAAAVESVDKVGPCSARFTVGNIEDVRAVKRKQIVDRAKLIVRDWSSKTSSEGENLLKDVTESTRRAKVISYGMENLPAGPGVHSSDLVYLVEGRADVVLFLRAGIENVVALEGTSIPDSIIELGKKKRLIAVLDGDRGGELIEKELGQVMHVEKVIHAPQGKEVEDLTPIDVINMLRAEKVDAAQLVSRRQRAAESAPPRQREEADEPIVLKTRELFPTLNGTLEAILLDQGLQEVGRFPISELVQKMEGTNSALYLIFDGIVTQRLVESAARVGVKGIIGHRTGELGQVPSDVRIGTFRDLGLE